ncbi:MAG: low molecular weight phosphotyrosine protein phosphatase [Spirochaetaceae bacterium]|nr:MAG: low molecular weight phosphotyrosine protein phosphatase [Spirochaetaceae bacterium]
MNKMKIMFVCTGNICRSPLAHAVLEHKAREREKSDSLEVESSGIHSYHIGDNADSRMRQTARDRGVTLDHKARHLSRQDLNDYDLLLAMDRSHYREMERMAAGDPSLVSKIKLFGAYLDSDRAPDIPDPYYGGQSGFDLVFEMVSEGCDALLEGLADELS